MIPGHHKYAVHQTLYFTHFIIVPDKVRVTCRLSIKTLGVQQAIPMALLTQAR